MDDGSVEAADLKSEVMQLAKQPAMNFFELASALSKLHRRDPEALRDLPDRSRLSRRRMYYLLQTGELIRGKHIGRKTAEYIGWTKLQILARHVADAEADAGRPMRKADFTELLALASEHKARDLAAALDGKSVVKKTVAHFYLTARERTQLDEALVVYGAEKQGGGLVGKERALMTIIREAMD